LQQQTKVLQFEVLTEVLLKICILWDVNGVYSGEWLVDCVAKEYSSVLCGLLLISKMVQGCQ